MADVKIDIAAEFTGNKAFKKAETSTQKLQKGVANLGKALISAFAFTKLAAFGKAAIKAFAADEKAARSLSLALANTGNAFAAIEVEKFIGDLQRTTGVLDDQLRPAFRTLLTATGDVKKSQDSLALALDIAAGTGKDLGSVSAALAKGFSGQTTALSRLGAGLSKATLASGDMDLITKELTKKFKGQALSAAEGYSGQMDRLAVASANAKEIIGKDLLDAMSMIAGKDGIGGATSAMEGFATEIGNAIYGIGVLTSKLNALPGAGAVTDFLTAPTGLLQLFSLFGKSQKAPTGQASPGGAGGIVARIKYQKELDRLARERIKIDKIDNDNTTRKLKLTGDQLALQELEKKFDIERIGLYAALNQTTDGETKMRLLSLIAIQEQNAGLAGIIKKASETTNALEAFRQGILSAIRAIIDKVQGMQADIINGTVGSTSGGAGTAAPSISDLLTQPMPSVPKSPLQSFRENEARYAGTGGVSISINPAVAGLIDVIQNQSASGISPTVNRVSSSYIA